jgi:hypothetical protein
MASNDVFANACVELCSGLWAELEQLRVEAEHELPLTQRAIADRSEILRLEIHLLITACDTARWRLLLDASQRLSLRSLLQDLLRAFDADQEQISMESIASAQNLLFDAVHGLCASSPSVFALGTPQNAADRAIALRR